MNIKKKKVLVVGGAGYIGTELTKELIKNFRLNLIPDYAINNCWMNVVQILSNNLKRKQIIDKFNKNKIYIRPVWKLNHTQKAFKKFQTYKIEKLINCLIIVFVYRHLHF